MNPSNVFYIEKRETSGGRYGYIVIRCIPSEIPTLIVTSLSKLAQRGDIDSLNCSTEYGFSEVGALCEAIHFLMKSGWTIGDPLDKGNTKPHTRLHNWVWHNNIDDICATCGQIASGVGVKGIDYPDTICYGTRQPIK